MRRRALSVSLSGIAFALLLASCGGGGAGSSTASTTAAMSPVPTTRPRRPAAAGKEAGGRERQAAESTLAAFLDARVKGDWTAVCSYLSASTRAQVETVAKGMGGKVKDCASLLAMSSKDETAGGFASPQTHGLTSLRVQGNSASALWAGPHGRRYAMPMVREGRGWRPAQVAPLPVHPAANPEDLQAIPAVGERCGCRNQA